MLTNLEQVDAARAANHQRLNDDEYVALLTYLKGGRTSAEFDNLSPEVQAAVNDFESYERVRRLA